jgi:hypothetical protein
VVASYVVADAFVLLRPGTSPADHLVSGVVPVVLLAAMAWVVPRVRSGVAASVCGTVGLATVIGGASAPGSALVADRISAAAVLGTAATVAGAVLMLVAAVMLFTSRRRDGSRLRRWSWRGARGAFGLALAVMIASPVGLAFMAANRSDPPPGELDLGRPHEDVTLHTSDGLALGGSYGPSTNGAAVIEFPGRSGSQTPGRARMLDAHGYGVLVFDPRGHGPARAIRTCSDGRARRTCVVRSASCRPGPMSIPRGSVVSACRSVAS